MKGIVFREFGGPGVLQLADLPAPPPPAQGEVAVDVVATTVNPTDLLMRSGQQAALMTKAPGPWIAGMEFSGRIAAVPHGGALAVGMPVIGVVNPRRPEGGAYAERIIVPQASVTTLAPGADLISAATVPMNSLTALLALEWLGLKPGALLLVTGGAGILGGCVISLAHQQGLKVLANAAGRDTELLRGLGADVVLPRTEGLANALREICPDGVDGLVDCALLGQVAADFVRDGGAAVSVRRNRPIDDPRLRSACVSVLDGMERSDLMEEIGADFAAGVLRPRVAPGKIFPAPRAAEAHAKAEAGGFRGRVVITFAPDPHSNGRTPAQEKT